MPVVDHVDYPAKRIYLSVDTVDASLDTLDVYREVRTLRQSDEAQRSFRMPIVAGGNIPKIPGVSYTPSFVQLLYGYRIVPYDVTHKLKVTRDTFTDDGFAGRDCFDRAPLSPSVDVDIDVDFERVEIREVTVGGGGAPTVAQIADGVLREVVADHQAVAGSLAAVLNARATSAEVAALVGQGLTSGQATMLLELFQLMGLDPGAPLIVSPTTRTAGAGVTQSIAEAAGVVTVTRAP